MFKWIIRKDLLGERLHPSQGLLWIFSQGAAVGYFEVMESATDASVPTPRHV